MKSLLAVIIVVALTNGMIAQDPWKSESVEALPSSTSATVVPDLMPAPVSSMLSSNKAIRSLTLDVAAEEKEYGHQVSQYTLKIKVLFLPDGKWYARYEQQDKEKRPVETLIIRDDKCDIINHQHKTVVRSQMSGNFVRSDVDELSGFCFPILPLLSCNKEYVDKHFSTSLVQADKDYTWIKFVPKTSLKQRDVRVALIGVINYENSVSPGNSPLYLAWLEPGGRQIVWRITQMSRNEAGLVRDSDFAVELREYERNGWKVQRNDGFALWKAFSGLLNKEVEGPGWVVDRGM